MVMSGGDLPPGATDDIVDEAWGDDDAEKEFEDKQEEEIRQAEEEYDNELGGN